MSDTFSALQDMPIAINTDKPKSQHYEVPSSFFKLVLGKHLKYRDLQLQNLDIIVADISTFETESSYDRIFSIGMLEHMKNYKDLPKKISNWMKEDSLLFVQHFCHKAFAYHFEDDVSVLNHWLVNGKHYAQTSEEWLKRMDKNMTSIKSIMEATSGEDSATKWTAYWRTFFIATFWIQLW